MKKIVKMFFIVFLSFVFINIDSIDAECTYTYLGTQFKSLKDYPFGDLEVNPAGKGATLSFDASNKKGKVTKRADYKIFFFIDQSWSFGGESTITSWKEQYCPMYITINNDDESDWRAFDERPDANEVYSNLKTGRISVFMNDSPELPTYECTYEGFKILFDYNGKAIIAESTLGTSFSYDLDESLTDQPAEEPGVCENVYTCVTTSVPPSSGSSGFQGYTIFSGSIDVASKQDSVCLDTVMTLFDYKIDEEVSEEGGDNSVCRTFKTRWTLLEDYHNMCSQKNVIYCQLYNDYKAKMKSWCNSVTNYIDYGDACLDKCLTLSKKISKLENKEGNGKTCGFSERLLIWIGNIVRWMKYIVPVIVIVFGILDFIKAMASSKEDEMKKAQKNFTIRLIAAALIFIAPFIIEFILDKMGFTVNGCGIIDL